MKKLIIPFLALMCLTLSCERKPASQADNGEDVDYVMTVARSYPSPVIDITHQGSADNQGGYENGHLIKIDGTYHLLMTELFSVRHPDWGSVPARVGYWTSKDGDHWERVCTIVQGNDILGDPKNNTWSSSWYWNEKENRWNVFWRGNAVFRYRSAVEGKDGMAGPYTEAAKVYPPLLGEKQDWDNGWIDSFGNIYIAEDGKFYTFVGVGALEDPNDPQWVNGLAWADDIDGPWTRVRTDGHPTFVYSENPFVYIYEINGRKVHFCVYDDLSNQHSLGYGYSFDGIHWVGKTMDMTGCADWAFNQNFTQSMRTPCGLIREDDGTYTIIFTAFAPNPEAPEYSWGSYAKIGRVNVRIDEIRCPSNKQVVFSGDMNNWKAVSGTFTVQYGREYSQSDMTADGYSVYTAATYTDVTVEASLRNVTPTQVWDTDAKAGIHVRKSKIDDKPADSGYRVYLTANETVQLYAGSKLLSEVNVGKQPGIFRKVKLSIKGNRIQVYYDGATEPCINVTDNTYKGKGYVGINVHQSHWHFDRIKVKI